MKINNFGNTPNINAYKKQMNKVEKAANTSASKGVDKVEISSAAKEMQQVSPILRKRQERVEELKNQVESGNYKIDPKEIAKSILNFYTK